MKPFKVGNSWAVQPVVDGRRPKITLGRMSKRDAESIALQVEHLVAAKLSGQPLPPGVASWLDEVSDTLHDRIARAGLCEPREAPDALPTIQGMTDAYIARRTDVKASTRTIYRQVQTSLVETLGADRGIDDITAADADDYRRLLHQRYAPATVCKLVKRAKTMFSDASKRHRLDANPFADLKPPSGVNRDRLRYVDLPTIETVLEAAPDAEWRALIILSRVAGLRTPSELLELRWSDVNWDKQTLTVRAKKTSTTRIIPLFPQVESALLDLFDDVDDGDGYAITSYRGTATNLRTRFQRIIDRAGVKPWPKLWHNLRASAETDLAQIFPAHVVCEWIGNSEAVARKHYLQVTEADIQKAVQKPLQIQVQNPLQHVQASVGTDRNESPKSAQNKGQSADLCLPLPASAGPIDSSQGTRTLTPFGTRF